MPVHRRPAPVHFFPLLFLLSAAIHVTAQNSRSFDCHFSVGDRHYDLSELAGIKVVNRTRDSPPTTYLDELRFDLCADMTPVEADRNLVVKCPSGTRACLTTINQKADNPERVTAVVPIAVSSSLEAETSTSSGTSPGGVVITLHGGSYPPSSSGSVSQSLKVSLMCAEGTTDPQFSSYENGQVLVEWNSSAACGTTGTPKEDEGSSGGGSGGREGDMPIENVGSGLGFFFLMLILAFAAYFAFGAYYKYSTYGARGWDLIPIEAGPKTKNIPGGAIFQKFATEAEAIRVFEAAKARGDVTTHSDVAENDKSIVVKSENAPLSPLGEVSLLSAPLSLNRTVESTGLQTPLPSPTRSRVGMLRRTLRDRTDSCSTSSSPPTNVTTAYLPLYVDDDTPPTSPVESSRHFTFTSSSSRAYPDVSGGEERTEGMRVPLEVSDWSSLASPSLSAHSRPGAEEHTSKSPGCMPLHPEPSFRGVGVPYQSLSDLADMQRADPRIWLPISRVFDPDKVKPRPLTRPPSPIKGSASPASSYQTARSHPPSEYQMSPMNTPFVRADRGRHSRLTPSLSLPVLPDRHLVDADEHSNCGSPRTQLLESRHTGKAKAKGIDCSADDKHLVEGHCPSPRNDARSHVQLVPRNGSGEKSVITVHCPPNCPHETCYTRPPASSALAQQPSRSTGPRYVDACVSPIITIPCRLQESPTKIQSKRPDLDKDRPHAFAGFTHVSHNFKGIAPESDVRSPVVRGTMVPMSVVECVSCFALVLFPAGRDASHVHWFRVGRMRWQRTSRVRRLACVTRLMALSDLTCFSVALTVTVLTHAFWTLQNTVWAAISSSADL
ncbi:autophagy-related protein 27-domain-containing protein [Chiua virens]|nr:autophagy-related protein 27-domain-containing protein [Chiua virens]